MKHGLNFLFPSLLMCGLLGCVTGERSNACDPNTVADEACRPFRTGIVKMNPDLDAVKPLGAIDESGWSLANNLLIGAVDSEWVGAYELKSKKFVWWLKTATDLTAPAEVFGSWAVLALRDGRLIKVEAQTGKVVWENQLNRFVSSRMALSGTTLLAYSVDQKLFAIDFQTGKNLWVFDAGSPSNLLLRASAGPVVAGNDVFIGSSEGEVRSINLGTGKESWSLDPGRDEARFRDVVGEIGLGNHQLYVTRYDGLVFAVDSGQRPSDVLWKENFPSITTSAYRDGTIYIGCINGDLIALQASSGRQLWKTNLGQSLKTLTIGEKAIFVGGSQGRISAVSNANGSLLWHDDLQGIIARQPIVVDEQIFFATGLKVLYSYKIL